MKLFLSIFILAAAISAFGQTADSTIGTFKISIRSDFGFIIAHRPALEPLQEEHVKGFEVSIARISTGEKEWQNLYKNPDYGITIAAFDLGSPSHLGKGIAVYPFIDFPLGNNINHGLHFRYGMGLGYVEKIFNAYDNYKNAGVGSHINGIIHFDLHFEKRILPLSFIELGAGITHFSNGSIRMPNLGINIATINLAFIHSFGKNIAIIRNPQQAKNKTTQIHVYAGGFYKRIAPPLGKTYGAFVISAMRLKPFNNKSAWGMGADIFHDNSIAVRIEQTELKDAKEINNFRTGIYGAYHLSIGHLGLMLNMGYYLYNAFKKDGNIYHRTCIRYYFEKTFLCLNLKTHYARADFLELGIGYRFLN